MNKFRILLSRQFDKTRASSWLRTPLPLFALAHFSHDMCPALLVPLLPLIRDDFRLTYLEAGLLVSAYSITSGFSQLPMGWVADKLGQRRLVVAGLGGVGLATFAVGFSHEFSQMLPILVIMGILAGAYHPSAISYFPRYFAAEKRGRALGFHLLGGSTGFMMGPVLAGIIAGVIGWRTAFIILSLPALSTALLFLRSMREEWKVPEEVMATATESDSSIWKTLQGIAVILSVAVLTQFIIGSAVNYLPIYFVDRHSVSPIYAAMLLALVRGGSVIGGPIGGALSDRFGIKGTVMLAVVGVGPALFLVAILPFNLVAVVITLLLLGVFLMMRQPAMQALIVNVSSQRHRSTLLGLYFFLGVEGMSLMVPVAGFFMDTFGLLHTFIGISATALLLSATTPLLWSKL